MSVVMRQLAGIRILLPLCGSWGLNSGCQAWLKAT